MPSTDLLEAMGRYNEELVEAVEWVKHSPNPMTPEQIEQEEQMREDLYGQQSQQDPQADAFKCADT